MSATIFSYSDCSTAGCRNLDLQIITQIQKIAPGLLLPFHQLNVSLGAGCHAYLQPPAAKALARAIAKRGVRMYCNSAFRTLAQQAILHAHKQSRRCGIRAAAQPGQSNHETALAIDIEDAPGWKPYLEAEGWDWIGSFDPMHYDFEGAGCKDMRWISIKAFQQLWNVNYAHIRRLLEDGKMGAQTLQSLWETPVTGFPKGINSTKLVSPPAMTQIRNGALREGMQGAPVTLLQNQLVKRGYKLAADGIYGKTTANTVRAFQLANGLDDDGVVGPSTRKALGLG